jgi:hypothetical protein
MESIASVAGTTISMPSRGLQKNKPVAQHTIMDDRPSCTVLTDASTWSLDCSSVYTTTSEDSGSSRSLVSSRSERIAAKKSVTFSDGGHQVVEVMAPRSAAVRGRMWFTKSELLGMKSRANKQIHTLLRDPAYSEALEHACGLNLVTHPLRSERSAYKIVDIDSAVEVSVNDHHSYRQHPDTATKNAARILAHPAFRGLDRGAIQVLRAVRNVESTPDIAQKNRSERYRQVVLKTQDKLRQRSSWTADERANAIAMKCQAVSCNSWARALGEVDASDARKIARETFYTRVHI